MPPPVARPVDPDLDRPSLRVVASVFAGGCLGGLSRYAVTSAWRPLPHGFPVAVLVVNLTGALCLGLLVAAVAGRDRMDWLRPLLGTGFLGAWTTFSAVAVDLTRLLDVGRLAVASGYALATFVGAPGVAAVGWYAGRVAFRGRRS